MNFEAWNAKVDEAFIKVTGLDRYSWPDQDYYDMWESGYTPMEALAAAIESEYGQEGLDSFGLESPF